MADQLYLRPLGVIWGKTAVRAVEDGLALPLSGGPGAFLAAEIIEGRPGATKRAVARASTIAAIEEPALQSLLARITAPRPPIAGIDWSRPRIMGILNVTPDSFSDGGRHDAPEAAASHARGLIAEGADIIDVGGESTRPGAALVSLEDERARVMPVIAALRGAPAPISIDTRKTAIMREAVAAGAAIINDVSALTHDPDSLGAAGALRAPVILMHAQGTPQTMQDNPTYADVLLEVYDHLEARIKAAAAAGVPREAIIVDPGIGFGKTFDHNLALMEGVAMLHGLGAPVLIGVSRKGVTGQLANEPDPQKRDFGSAAAAAHAASQGVQIVRVHNVAATRQALTVWRAASMGENLA
ncbi:MAG: dihydropteroate synthase [Hyphomicrobiales bacterium]|nr:dihydropteroate synthase [Hyphomicrobiales bacterium]